MKRNIVISSFIFLLGVVSVVQNAELRISYAENVLMSTLTNEVPPDPQVRQYAFGEGISDPDVQQLFRNYTTSMLSSDFLLIPTTEAYKKSMGSRAPWVQDLVSAYDSSQVYYLMYLAESNSVVAVEKDVMEYALEHNIGFPLYEPQQYTYFEKQDTDHIEKSGMLQMFEKGDIQYVSSLVIEDWITKSPLEKKEARKFQPFDVGGNTSIGPGAGIKEHAQRSAFLVAFAGRTAEFDHELFKQISLGSVVQRYGNQLVQPGTLPSGEQMEFVYSQQDRVVYIVPPVTITSLHEQFGEQYNEKRTQLGAPYWHLTEDKEYDDNNVLVYHVSRQYFERGLVLIDHVAHKTEIREFQFASQEGTVAQRVGVQVAPSQGNSTIGLVRVRFPDLDYSLAESDTFYKDAFNNEQGLTFTSYWKSTSNGKFIPRVDIRTFMMPKSLKFYLEEEYGSTDQPLLISSDFSKKMENRVFQELKKQPLDWQTFDTNGKNNMPDGVVDGLFLTYDVNFPQLEKVNIQLKTESGFYLDHPHASSTYFLNEYKSQSVMGTDGKTYVLGTYSTCEWLSCGLTVFTHEFGHQIGLTDLYDTSYRSEGLADLSLMSYSHLRLPIFGQVPSFFQHGNIPQLLDAFSRQQLGWAEVKEVKGTEEIVIPPSTDSAMVVRLGKKDEYFLLENRRQKGFDKAIHGEGLAIYAINEKKINAFSCATCRHYDPLIRLIPTDGQYPILTNQYYQNTTLHTVSPFLRPSDEPRSSMSTFPMFDWGTYYHDTNFSDGSSSGIYIDEVDTVSDYPNIKVKVRNFGPQGEYKHIIQGVNMTPGEADVDGNGRINEEDHSALLLLAQKGQIALDKVKQAMLGLRLAVAEKPDLFLPTSTPLNITVVETKERGHMQLLLSVQTSTQTQITAQYGSSLDHLVEVPGEYIKGENAYGVFSAGNISKVHSLFLSGLEPGQAYHVEITAENAWGERIKKVYVFSTEPYLLLNGKLVTVNADVEFVAGVTPPEYMDNCLQQFNFYVQEAIRQTSLAISPGYLSERRVSFIVEEGVRHVVDTDTQGNKKIYLGKDLLTPNSSYCAYDPLKGDWNPNMNSSSFDPTFIDLLRSYLQNFVQNSSNSNTNSNM